MKKVVIILLGCTFLLAGISPAVAATVAGIPVGKFVLRRTVGKNTVNKMSSYVLRRGETSLQGFSYATFVERWAYSGYGAEAAARFSTLEKVQLFENRLATKLIPALSKQEVIGFLSEPQKLAEVSKLKYSQQDYFYLNALPEQVIEGEMPLTTDSLNKFLGYNRDVLLLNGYSLEGWARQMGAITNLGLFGGIEDARAILDVAKSTRLEKDITDLITARALINLDAYRELQEMVNFRLEGLDPLGNPAELSYVWRDVGEYLNRKGIAVEIPTDRISILPLGATRDAEELLAKYNSYNLFNKDSGWQLTENFTELRNNIQEAITQHQIEEEINKTIRAEVKPVKPIEQPKRYESPFASFRKEDWEIAEESNKLSKAEEEFRQNAKTDYESTKNLSNKQLRREAMAVGMNAQQINTMEELGLLKQTVAVMQNMSKKIPSRFDAYVEDNYENFKELGDEEKGNLLRAWAKDQPDFFYKNFEFNTHDYDLPFNEKATGFNVLLINDDPIYVKDVLKAAEGKINVTTTNSINEGIEWLENQHYDIILTDFNTQAGHPYDLGMKAYKKGIRVVIGSRSGSAPYRSYEHGIIGDVRDLSPEEIVNYLSNVAVTGRAFPAE